LDDDKHAPLIRDWLELHGGLGEGLLLLACEVLI